MDLIELTSIAASMLGGASVLLIAYAVLPAMSQRQAMRRRLRAVAEGPVIDDELAGVEPVLSKRFDWSALTTQSPWLLRLVKRLAPFIVAAAVVTVLSHNILLVIAAELQVWMFTSLLGQGADAGRSARLDSQMLPTILRLTAAIRAGASLIQGLEIAAEDAPSPMREELRAVLDEVALGTSLDTALEHMADRLGTHDYLILSLVLTVQRRVGGNLPVILERISETIRERIESRRQVAVLTSQQRMSTWILALLPFFVAGVFLLADRSFMLPLVTTTPGYIILVVASLLQLVGGWALRWAGREEDPLS